MFKYFLPSFKHFKPGSLKTDIPAGLIVAALSIPVAMGYAQIAGLAPVYGLYASTLPVLGYVLFASSPRLVYGIDAASAAITGSCLAGMGIASGSSSAAQSAPVLALFAAVFLILFALLRLGRAANYISATVMSGFISGIALTIIVGQLPKIIGIPGGKNAIGDFAAIAENITKTNFISFAIGVGTVALVLVGKRFLPKWPVALIVLVLGTAASGLMGLDQAGVAVVGNIPSGMPAFSFPLFWQVDNLAGHVLSGFVVSIVVFAGSLLPSVSFATRDGYAIDTNQEVFAFGFSNLVSSFFGCPPTSASVSRTAASGQFRGKSQVVSITAVAVMILVVIFFSKLLYYMPQALLSGIVLAAMVGVIDINVLARLWRHSRADTVIWLASALAVVFVGILFGVAVGLVLSFADVVLRIVSPPQAFLGRIDGKDDFYSLSNPDAKAIPGVVIYRFSAPLFFANAALFAKGIDKALAQKPRAVIIDASGIGSVDINAADTLKESFAKVKKAGVELYVAGEISSLNTQLKKMGINEGIRPNHTTKTIDEALVIVETSKHDADQVSQ